MGRGNVCTFHSLETLFYLDKENYSVYYSPKSDCCYFENELDAEKEDIADCSTYLESASLSEFDSLIAQVQDFITKKIKSFHPVCNGKADVLPLYKDVSVFLENDLYQIGWADNQNSIAFLLLQRTDSFGELQNGLCKRHFETYSKVLRDALFEHTDSLGVYKGAWCSGYIHYTDYAEKEN